MNLTVAEAVKLDQSSPENQVARPGTRIKIVEDAVDVLEAGSGDLVIQKVSIIADATGAFAFTAKYAMELIDVKVVSTATSGSGTATVRRATTAMTDAIIMAAADVITRAASIIQAAKAITLGESLNVITNGANDRGIVYLYGIRS